MMTGTSHIRSPLFMGTIYILVFALGFPVIYLLSAFLLDTLLGNPLRAHSDITIFVGIIIGTAGLGMIAATTWVLIKNGKGLPLSSSPPQKLVVTGTYHWSRHPVYVGTLLLSAGIATGLSSFWGLVFGLPMLTIFYFSYARGIEEPVLLSRYGEAYRLYCDKVPFFMVYPFHGFIRQKFHRILYHLSAIINRPGILRRGDHILFWGYGIWPGIGVAIGLGIMEYLLLAQGVPSSLTAGVIIVVTIFCLMGTRFVWRVITAVRKRKHFKNTSGEVGFMSWGVLPALIIIFILFGFFTSYPAILLFDAALPGILMAHFWGRIGCMFYGCCYGKTSEGICSLHYGNPAHKVIRIEKIPEKTVIPIQIASALYGLVGSVAILIFWISNGVPVGLPAAMATLWYGSFRISEEWLREQSVVWFDFISPAQIVAFILVVAGLAGLVIIGEGHPVLYKSLTNSPGLPGIFGRMHPLLLFTSGVLTTFVFSYHYKEIGQWK